MNDHNPDFKRQTAPVHKEVKPPVSLWDGWIFENSLIYSPSGEFFSKRDIELSWQSSKIVDDYYGNSNKILLLKKELHLRNRLTKIPTVSLIFENEDGPDETYFFDLFPAHKER